MIFSMWDIHFSINWVLLPSRTNGAGSSAYWKRSSHSMNSDWWRITTEGKNQLRFSSRTDREYVGAWHPRLLTWSSAFRIGTSVHIDLQKGFNALQF
ncbi:hypothetical protein Tco_1329468 [Tanacetum coccineum]